MAMNPYANQQSMMNSMIGNAINPMGLGSSYSDQSLLDYYNRSVGFSPLACQPTPQKNIMSQTETEIITSIAKKYNNPDAKFGENGYDYAVTSAYGLSYLVTTKTEAEAQEAATLIAEKIICRIYVIKAITTIESINTVKIIAND